MPDVILKARRAQPFYARHPWVYAGAIASVHGDPTDGAEVVLRSSAGRFVAHGLFNSQSKIRVRLYSWDEAKPLDESLFRDRIAAAVRLRRDVLSYEGPGGACRLVFSEADGLSGLTVDRYDRWLTVQFTSLALASRRDLLARLLLEETGCEGAYLRTERGVGKLEGLALADGPLLGTLPTGPVEIDLGGLRWAVDLAEGQKTGSYLDQRDNHPAAARYAKGRRVLDVCTYAGGFALHCLKAGAESVEGVDVSSTALLLAAGNAVRNGLSGANWIKADAFDHLAKRKAEGAKFGMVILDPPKFARARHAIPDALRGYRRLQALAVDLLEPDGILVMCCCSGLITAEMLEDVQAQVAADAKRDVQLLERRTQAADHPVSLSCREGGYLKCLISRVN